MSFDMGRHDLGEMFHSVFDFESLSLNDGLDHILETSLFEDLILDETLLEAKLIKTLLEICSDILFDINEELVGMSFMSLVSLEAKRTGNGRAGRAEVVDVFLGVMEALEVLRVVDQDGRVFGKSDQVGVL